VINKYGLDTIMELDYTNKETPVKIKSVCQIDHFDRTVSDEHHSILD